MGSSPYEVIPLDENSWRIEDTFVRAFLFRGTDRALLVDTTNGSGDLRAIVKTLIGSHPLILVNTHADGDHIGCNGQFTDAFMHSAEFAYYGQKKKPGYAEPRPLRDGEVLELGGRDFEVILAPGHTSGSILLLNRRERFLVGGDTILPYVYIFGPARDLRALIASLERLVTEYGDSFDFVYASHRQPIIPREFVDKELAAAKLLLAGRLKGKDPGAIPLEPPDYRPALLYEHDGAAFYAHATPPVEAIHSNNDC